MKKFARLLPVLILALGAFGVASPARAQRPSFVVTTKVDNGDNTSPTAGSLREAIINANAARSSSDIVFNIPAAQVEAGGTFTIQPPAELPEITHDFITIDGATQTAFTTDSNTGGPEIVIDGSLAGAGADGLTVSGTDFSLNSLVINNFATGNGVLISGNGSVITGCYIGTNATATAAAANRDGIVLTGTTQNHTIGGTTVAARNVISGNTAGIAIDNVANSTVSGNYLGTNAAGTAAIPNTATGIQLRVGSTNNTVGGTVAGAGNLISGNANIGVAMLDAGVSGNFVQGNLIGTNAAGTAALPNQIGVSIAFNATSNTVGGTAAGARNIISGNTLVGVEIGSTGTTGNLIQGNFIGTDLGGTAAIANGDGVYIITGATGNVIGSDIPTIVAGEGNTIAFNTRNGIYVTGTATTGNRIRGNNIFSNGSLGIDLGNDGVTTNDTGDTDTGPNNLQNYPVIASINTPSAGNIGVSGTLNSAATRTFYLDFYANAAADATGFGEGQEYLGSATVTTNGAGDATFTATIASNFVNQYITAVATDSTTGDTSEFSRAVKINSYVVTNTLDDSTTPPSGSLRAAINFTNAGAGRTVMFDIPGVGVQTIQPVAALPAITAAGTMIDGYTQPGASANTLAVGDNAVLTIELNGTNAGVGVNGFNILSDGNTVRGLVINGFSGAGISIDDVAGTVVQGNFIGTTASGTTSLGNGTDGLIIFDAANTTTVGGSTAAARNIISGNTRSGVNISDLTTTNNLVQGTYIGTNAAGTAALGNGSGVLIQGGATQNTIGGATTGERNVISGNTGDGININSFGSAIGATTDNTVSGNYIGTNAAGTAALGNDNGIVIDFGATANKIGLAVAGGDNLISGHSGVGGKAGILIGVNCSANIVVNNRVGTNASGTAAVANHNGIGIGNGASNNTIGGDTALERNIISGNNNFGLHLSNGATGNSILGNFIGTQIDGTSALGNGAGVRITAEGPALAAVTNNTIGSATAGEGNVIAFNGTGVSVVGDLNPDPAVSNASTGNSIRGNSIFSNTNLGIDLEGGTESSSGVTRNDVKDADDGANGLQNYPVITSVANNANSVVSGTINSVPGETFVVDLYSNTAADASGYGEGQTYLGSATSSVADANGDATFTFTATGVNLTGKFVTATATNAAKRASELGRTFPRTGPGVVINTNDSGAGSLRQAILDSNARLTTDIIFDIPGAGVHTIAPTSALPIITESVIIDGYSQPGASANTNATGALNTVLTIAIDGTGGGNSLAITNASNCVIRGLNLRKLSGNGVSISGTSTGISIRGCFIGTDATGATAAANGGDGVLLDAVSNNTIGGTTPADRNLISGNFSSAVEIRGAAATSNLIQGNLTGLNAAGTTAVANGNGIFVTGTSNTIGGTTTSARNVVSGSPFDGVTLQGDSNVVRGNYIGTSADGNAAAGNREGVIVTGSNNIIGGTVAGAANIIAFNVQNGVIINGAAAIGDSIRGNSIHDNGGLGISLQGGNNSQNYPIITSVVSGTNSVVKGTLNSTVGATFTIDVYSNTAADPSGNGEGQTYLGNTTTAATNASGDTTFTFTATGVNLAGKSISATATRTSAPFDTSEFSLVARSAQTYEVDTTSDSPAFNGCDSTVANDCSLRGAITNANNNSGVTDTINFEIPAAPRTISPTSALPAITDPVIIDGYSQTGASPNTLATGNNGVLLIELNGASTLAGINCFSVTGGGTTIKGLVINRFAGGAAISTLGGGSNTFVGNFIGTDAAGTAASANQVGIAIATADDLIGTSTATGTPAVGDRNVIAGNSNTGISITGASAMRTVVKNNYIGLGADGATALGNGVGDGVYIQTATRVIVGGDTSAERNIIGAHTGAGVHALNATLFTVSGNYIGTDATGALDKGNADAGVFQDGGSDNIIGGGTAAEGNLISGNHIGISVANSVSAGGNSIDNNIIGLNAAGVNALKNDLDGLAIQTSTNTIVDGNRIAGNGGTGISVVGDNITSATNNQVFGNVIGLNVNGVARPNATGVSIGDFSNTNTVGGNTPAERNIISGNTNYGVLLTGSATTNTVSGNYIGTNVAGAAAIGNGQDGVNIATTASANTVGGTTVGERNVISGNNNGVAIFGNTNIVVGNYIGTDGAGTARIANAAEGVLIQGSTNTIGGATGASRNVISGNNVGLKITGATNKVQNNFIGTDNTGTAAMGNTLQGVLLFFGAANNTVGGVGTGNTIAFNGGDGVVVSNNGAGNSIRANSIFSNTGLGIDLDDNGISANDAPANKDSDTGSNDLQNFPVVTGVAAGANSVVSGTLNSTAGAAFVIDLYSNTAADPSGNGEGQTYLGNTTSSVTDASGNATFTFTATGVNLNGKFVSATATNTAKSTSEFSATRQGAVGPVPTITSFSPGSERRGAIITITGTGFTGATAVKFNGQSTPVFTVNSATQITATVPAAASSGAISVTTSGGTATSATNFLINPGYVVTNTNNANAGSLEEAISFANGNAGTDTISFNIPGAGVHTIAPAPPLPIITEAVTIDGYSQSGAKANTLLTRNNAVLLIELNGTSAGASGKGLEIEAPNCVIKGLVINRFNEGIHFGPTLATGNTVEGCFIGTDAAGATDLGNGTGVRLHAGANGNTIGGATPAQRNLISGNQTGVLMEDVNTTNNTVANCYIGTDKAGSAALGNGVGISLGAIGNTVGGSAAQGNVISGNTGRGVSDVGNGSANAVGNTITGNIIGLNVSQIAKVPNLVGVVVSSRDKTIIGTVGAGRNIIAGNTQEGIQVLQNTAGPETIKIQGNKIGTNSSDAKNLGNGFDGIFLGGRGDQILSNTIVGNGRNGIQLFNASGTLIQQNNIGFVGNGNVGSGVFLSNGAKNNVIGGTATDTDPEPEGNLISGNAVGVEVNSGASDAIGNSIRGNTITDNIGLGIDLRKSTEAANTPTANDTGDGDSGNDNLQNYPVITGISGKTISGTLNSVAGTAFSLDFYDNTAADASGFGEGATGLGTTTVTTNAGGNATFTFTATSAPTGFVTATATNRTTGDTSEFSGARSVAAVAPTITSFTPASGPRGTIVTITGTGFTGATAVTFNGQSTPVFTVVSSTRITATIPASASSGPIRVTAPGGTATSATNFIVTAGYVVTNTRDIGAGSLRDALTYTNAHAGADSISFRIPTSDPGFSNPAAGGTGAFTIQPGSALPTITSGATAINGATQTAAIGNTSTKGPEIVLNGSLAGAAVSGLRINSSGNRINSLVINGFTFDGITISNGAWAGNIVTGCYLGTNAIGTAAQANASYGIAIFGGPQNTIIGGRTVAARNVISGNRLSGIGIIATGTANNTVQGNIIGLNALGTGAIPNGDNGVVIFNGAINNTIGGAAVGARNIISGNGLDGVQISGAGTDGNTVAGNIVGLNAAGTARIANGNIGVDVLNGAKNNLIGGATTLARNFVSGNTRNGIGIGGSTGATSGSGTTGNKVQGNYIGTNAAGTAAVGNGLSGIAVGQSARSNVIGGTNAGEGNLISGGLSNGVILFDAGTSLNTVVGNRIGTNAAGTSALPNLTGILINQSASGNVIGGKTSAARNLISGNSQYGILISGGASNTVQGNYIGTNLSGTGALPNLDGVLILGASAGNVIGGTASGAGNLLSGNSFDGLQINGTGANSNSVFGNRIGTKADGTSALGNAHQGVAVIFGAKNNTIGGVNAGARNIIAFNSGDGVRLSDAATIGATTGNVIRGNSIHDNGKLGINLVAPG